MLSVKANPGFSERSQHNLHITRHEVAQADGKLHATQHASYILAPPKGPTSPTSLCKLAMKMKTTACRLAGITQASHCNMFSVRTS